MCGIAGAYSFGSAEVTQAAVEEIVRMQHRRGPDFESTVRIQASRGHVVLGHNRLAIIDLSQDANQPMWDAERRRCLVFNGEIYNYIEIRDELKQAGVCFRTSSDSEVILAAFAQWGAAAVERFNGMFAFALYDRATSELWLVRDRFGVKPLYYWCDRKRFYFASAGTPLSNVAGLTKSLDYVSRGLRYWVYDDGTRAPYENMKAVGPGTHMCVRPDQDGGFSITTNRYYDLQERVSTLAASLDAESEEQLRERVSSVLQDAVRIRLRADVPVGISLSGGLDSSVVAALTLENTTQPVTAFTFGSLADRKSEASMVHQFAKQANLNVVYIDPDPAAICHAYRETLEAQGAPFPSTSMIAQNMIFKAAREHGVKVMLGGQGGDEAFMGYLKFRILYFKELLQRRDFWSVARYGFNAIPGIVAGMPGLSSLWSIRQRFLRKSGASTILQLPEPEPIDLGLGREMSILHRQMLDVTQFSLPTLLRYEDRNSMGNSIESRLPFLDYRVIECGLALPVALKIRGGMGKAVIRELARGRIPESIRNARYKRGFDVQQKELMGQGIGEVIREVLHERSSSIRDFLSPTLPIEDYFSNESLKKRPAAFAEATALAWLGTKKAA